MNERRIVITERLAASYASKRGGMNTASGHARRARTIDRWMPPLLRQTAERDPQRVLVDLGAGDGGTLWPLDQAGLVGETIHAVDISAKHVELCGHLVEQAREVEVAVTPLGIADREERDGLVPCVDDRGVGAASSACSPEIEHTDSLPVAPMIASIPAGNKSFTVTW